MSKIDKYRHAAAVIRAEEERLEEQYSTYGEDGTKYTDSESVDKALEDKFGLPRWKLSSYFTYARGPCNHPWSDGACPLCPPADHCPLPPKGVDFDNCA